MKRIGTWITGAVVALGSTVIPGPLGPTAACAAEGPRAVLVVDTGESELSMCVALPEPSVSGLELIELAGEQHGLTYRFGFGGNAVCMLADVGTTSDDCFEEYPDFWGYWRGDGSGGWSWSGSGAGSTTVSDGDVEGWSWGSGSDGDTHPQPPATRFGDVCPVAQAPKPKPKPQQPQPGPRQGSGGGPADGGDAGETRRSRGSGADRGPGPGRSGDNKEERDRKRPRNKDQQEDRKKRRPERKGGPRIAAVDPTPSPYAAELPAAVTSDDRSRSDSDGPPVTGLVALGATALLGGAGFVFARRRRAP